MGHFVYLCSKNMKKQEKIPESHQSILEQLGELLKKHRKERRIGYIDAAKDMGLSKNTLSPMENGRLNFQFTTLLQVLNYYDVTLSEFFNELNEVGSKPGKNPVKKIKS